MIELRRSTDSAVSISFTKQLREPILVVKVEKNFIRPPTIRVSSRGWTTLPETLVQNTTVNSTSLPSNWSPLQVWNPASDSWPLPPPPPQPALNSPWSLTWNVKWSKKQNLRCVVFGLLICILLSLALGITLHFQRSEISFDGSTGPTGSLPGQLPGPPLPVLGVTAIGGNYSSIYFGVALDWKLDDPGHFNSQLGYPAAIQDSIFYMGSEFNTTSSVNSSGVMHTVSDVYIWTASLIRGTGAIMQITIIPTVSLTSLHITTLPALAAKCKEINQMGIPILLRFGPMMNGNWFIYGQDPIPYKSAFQRLSSLVRNATNNTAMVWSPASGLNYPFQQGMFFPMLNETRYPILDTNSDGFFNSKDDPYLPYFPGESFVDWGGISLIYTSGYQLHPANDSETNVGTRTVAASITATSFFTSATSSPTLIYETILNSPVPVGSFESQLIDSENSFNFYDQFCAKFKKPVLINTGAAFFRGEWVRDIISEESLKAAWNDQILNRTLFLKYPLIRGVVMADYAESLNQTSYSILTADPATIVDFRISANSSVLSYLQTTLASLIRNASDTTAPAVLAFVTQNSSLSVFQ